MLNIAELLIVNRWVIWPTGEALCQKKWLETHVKKSNVTETKIHGRQKRQITGTLHSKTVRQLSFCPVLGWSHARHIITSLLKTGQESLKSNWKKWRLLLWKRQPEWHDFSIENEHYKTIIKSSSDEVPADLELYTKQMILKIWSKDISKKTITKENYYLCTWTKFLPNLGRKKLFWEKHSAITEHRDRCENGECILGNITSIDTYKIHQQQSTMEV
jgi:hypothetical protein